MTEREDLLRSKEARMIAIRRVGYVRPCVKKKLLEDILVAKISLDGKVRRQH